MHICFLIYNISRPGGSERVTALIANEFVKKGFEVSILNICGTNKCFYDISDKIHMHTLFYQDEINHKKKYLSIVKGIKKYYKENKVDISIEVFASLSLYVLPIKKKLGIKNITWEHFNFSANLGLNKIGRKVACKHSDAIVVLTNDDKNEYIENIKKIKAKLDYIYNPTPYPDAPKTNLENKNVITVGRLTYQKGYDILLDVWKLVEEKNKDWKLQIYGIGEDEKMLKEKKEALKLNNVFFMGKTNEIDKCYVQSSIYVSSSRFEGLPMCLIEAQSFGLPIVSFDYKNGPKEIIKNNINGYIVENEKDMAEKLLDLMNNKEKLMSFSNNTKESDNFKINKIIEKWMELLENLK